MTAPPKKDISPIILYRSFVFFCMLSDKAVCLYKKNNKVQRVISFKSLPSISESGCNSGSFIPIPYSVLTFSQKQNNLGVTCTRLVVFPQITTLFCQFRGANPHHRHHSSLPCGRWTVTGLARSLYGALKKPVTYIGAVRGEKNLPCYQPFLSEERMSRNSKQCYVVKDVIDLQKIAIS